MSVIKRLGNLGKGLWSVNTKGEDAESKARIEALRKELESSRPAPRARPEQPAEPLPRDVEPAPAPLERAPDGSVKRTL